MNSSTDTLPPAAGAPAAGTAVTPQALRAALGMFATGVTIITARDTQGVLRGFTANSFNSVSLDPPLVLWSLAKTSSSFEAFAGCGHYAVNVLSAEQLPLARRFATRGIDRWTWVEHQAGAGGSPVLAGSAAVFECAHRTVHEAGDHVIFIGEVVRCHHTPGTQPLLFHGGRFYSELPLADEPDVR
ncbi:MAG: p-hydroxyphenylacetate 3-hydroxylase, reductase component [Paracidovorax wautersii]|uniref:p-hydroxyphenylacetate 3-hydroxylase, reductase component n=1 Tax=Paracidovorax wautersii TaxID=1177982 RepID=A0A7V8JPT7_9BURK|nr:MAG: p-hydroxyphenylacetate 3-hydroxylase, reductase component [Paracidovorax wautersii]